MLNIYKSIVNYYTILLGLNCGLSVAVFNRRCNVEGIDCCVDKRVTKEFQSGSNLSSTMSSARGVGNGTEDDLPAFSGVVAVIACSILKDRLGMALPVYFLGSGTCCSLGWTY